MTGTHVEEGEGFPLAFFYDKAGHDMRAGVDPRVDHRERFVDHPDATAPNNFAKGVSLVG